MHVALMPRACTCTNSRPTHRRAFAFQPRGILQFTHDRVCSQSLKPLGKQADPAADAMVDRMVPLELLIRVSYRTGTSTRWQF